MRILCGIETEYGLLIEGRGPEEQITDAAEVVQCHLGPCFVGWDYRSESPRQDLRGFTVDRLAVDPRDQQFDQGVARPSDQALRSDRVLINGARFYNDHGHPEYATPECWSSFALAREDRLGESIVLSAAQTYAERTGRNVQVFKNNTDFHGASYGTHESYLLPRSLTFEQIQQAVLPMLIARQILTGAGKAGFEHGEPAEFQISQRADFFMETANVETLFRRPILNTRDEPHANRANYQRLHVISGDANRMMQATARKTALVRIALELGKLGTAPKWEIKNPVAAFQAISKDATYAFECQLEDGTLTTAYDVLESYFMAYDKELRGDPELDYVVSDCRELMAALKSDFGRFRRNVDWAAKKFLVEQYLDELGDDCTIEDLQTVDLAYSDLDAESSLFQLLIDQNEIDDPDVEPTPSSPIEPTRARARAIAVEAHRDHLQSVSWGRMVFKLNSGLVEVDLPPDVEYASIQACSDVESFITQFQKPS